jgi:hypothetical protein
MIAQRASGTFYLISEISDYYMLYLDSYYYLILNIKYKG